MTSSSGSSLAVKSTEGVEEVDSCGDVEGAGLTALLQTY